MGKKDIVSKDIINTLVIDIAKYIIGLDVKKLTLIDKEFQRVEDRRADVVANVDDEYILHIEIQNQNDKSMDLRMLRYYTDIKSSTNLPIKQYLIYIGKNKLSMNGNIDDFDLNYKYNIIDIKNIDCEEFIKMDTPDSLVLAILCDFKGKDEQEVVNYIIQRLQEKTDNDALFRKYLIMLEELSENRNLKNKIKKGEKMLTEINYEKLPSFELGMEEGIETGIQKGIETGIQKGIQKGKEEGKQEGLILGIKGVYTFEKNPQKIATLLNVDEEFVIKTINQIKG